MKQSSVQQPTALFPDTEPPENLPQHLLRLDRPRDPPQRLRRTPQILGPQLEFLHRRAKEGRQRRPAAQQLLAVPRLGQRRRRR